MVADWVVARRPHVVFVELAINDGDTLLETEQPAPLGAAFEGILRHVRDALPQAELCLLHMFIRDDLPLARRTGSKAWAENDDARAAATYTERVPALHNAVAAAYGVPSITLAPAFCRMEPELRDAAFRDDCHLHEPGAAYAAAAIAAALDALFKHVPRGAPGVAGFASPGRALPPPVHERPWGRGRAQEVTPQQLSFFYVASAPSTPAEVEAVRTRLLQRHTQLDMDPLDNARQRPWWLLYPGDEASVSFRGTRLGFLTMIGPDAGWVSCEVDGGRWCVRVNLLDQWAYFWRLAVVPLLDELPSGEHTATIRLEHEMPDRSVLRKLPSGPHWASFQREGKTHKLWLMHWLIEEESERERALTRAGAVGQGDQQAARLGGANLASGGRRADAY